MLSQSQCEGEHEGEHKGESEGEPKPSRLRGEPHTSLYEGLSSNPYHPREVLYPSQE